ncbi:MAG: hypothetical protein L0I76_36785, partial [Pseudonocardia sp.]|nr:hypothetical protein [Pseudonocardia sp.]
MREISPADAARVEDSLRAADGSGSDGSGSDGSGPDGSVLEGSGRAGYGHGVGGLDGVEVATMVSDALGDPTVLDDAEVMDRVIDADRLARFA